MNTLLLTALVLFLTGFFGDLTAQFLGRYNPIANLFAPYWQRFGSFGAATIAGLITLVFGGLFLLAAIGIYNALKLDIKSWSFVLFATALGVVLGVFADVITNYNNYIPTLRLWYDTVGPTYAALWGGGISFGLVAFMASVFLVYWPSQK